LNKKHFEKQSQPQFQISYNRYVAHAF
jgi:hypothetical protein